MNSILVATGSNLGIKKEHLFQAKKFLSINYHPQLELIEESRIYQSQAVDFLDQPFFLNQVLFFKTILSPLAILKILLDVEIKLGRDRNTSSNIKKGPRIIDCDLIFYNQLFYTSKALHLPHPEWRKREFVTGPMGEITFGKEILKEFDPQGKIKFSSTAFPLQ